MVYRLTFDPPGLPKEFDMIPVGGWPTQACQHEFGKDDYVDGAAGRCYTCRHCRATVLFNRIERAKPSRPR
jgi:hypothetical protein